MGRFRAVTTKEMMLGCGGPVRDFRVWSENCRIMRNFPAECCRLGGFAGAIIFAGERRECLLRIPPDGCERI